MHINRINLKIFEKFMKNAFEYYKSLNKNLKSTASRNCVKQFKMTEKFLILK